MFPHSEPGPEGSGDPRWVVDTEGWWVTELEVLGRRRIVRVLIPKGVSQKERWVQKRDV